MDYLGAKWKLSDWIFNVISYYSKEKNLTFLDACAGSGSMSVGASRNEFSVVANDVMEYSRCILSGILLMNENLIEEATNHIEIINNLKPTEGFFLKEYSERANRLYFTNENAKRIDASRQYVDIIEDKILKDYLIYCLIEAVSRVSNTAGTYGAFLKKLKSRALEPLIIKLENYYTSDATVYSEDILFLLNNEGFKLREDIMYIDPPYNNRQYGANYHIYETLARYDYPYVKGVTGLRDWINESKSPFCIKSKALPFLIDILKSSNAKLILLSYSSDGIMDFKDILCEVNNVGFECSIHIKPYKRYKSDSKRDYRSDALFEYLFVFIR